jgi:hypothetical protein
MVGALRLKPEVVKRPRPEAERVRVRAVVVALLYRSTTCRCTRVVPPVWTKGASALTRIWSAAPASHTRLTGRSLSGTAVEPGSSVEFGVKEAASATVSRTVSVTAPKASVVTFTMPVPVPAPAGTSAVMVAKPEAATVTLRAPAKGWPAAFTTCKITLRLAPAPRGPAPVS